MKSTGMTRPVDSLGRVVLPTELRNVLGIKIGDALNVFVDAEAETIALSKHEPGCVFCHSITSNRFKGKIVCKQCADEAKDHEIEEW